jgi:hypothetical protein
MPATQATPEHVSVRIERTANGVQFQLKAGVFETFFSQLASVSRSNGTPALGSDRTFGTARLYMFSDRERESLLSIPGAFHELETGRLLDPSGNVNLSVLTVVGSGAPEGVTFTVKTVMSKTQLKSFTEGLNKLIRAIYMEFMQPEVNTIEFTIRHTITP